MSVSATRPRQARASARADFQRHALCPKPRGLSIDAILGRDLPRRPTNKAELRALRFIVEHGDLLEAGGASWLLVPAPAALVDALATVDAALEDFEPDTDREDNNDDAGDSMEWSPASPHSRYFIGLEDCEGTTPERLDQSRPLPCFGGEDAEDEFGQRLPANAALRDLMPEGFSDPRPWRDRIAARTTLKRRAQAARADELTHGNVCLVPG
jgi:hypothetical protein